MRLDLILLGCGGHAKQVIDIVKKKYYGIEIYDDNKSGTFYGYPISGKISDLTPEYVKGESFEIFCCIGDNKIRKELFIKFKDCNWINCISDRIEISNSAVIGKGNYIDTNILSDSKIGDANILNIGSILTHDLKLGSFNHIAPGATICGNVQIGDNNLISAGSVLIPKVIIKDNIIFGAGSIVIKSILEPGTYLGHPVNKLLGKI